jgi:hypothetical protein
MAPWGPSLEGGHDGSGCVVTNWHVVPQRRLQDGELTAGSAHGPRRYCAYGPIPSALEALRPRCGGAACCLVRGLACAARSHRDGKADKPRFRPRREELFRLIGLDAPSDWVPSFAFLKRPVATDL